MAVRRPLWRAGRLARPAADHGRFACATIRALARGALKQRLLDTGLVAGVSWLLCDADDTLWENNVYFERAIAQFIRYLDHPRLSSDAVRRRLDEIEIRNIKRHGYGTKNFTRNLLECFEALRGRPAAEEDRCCITGMTDPILNCEIELLPGVAETLAELSRRHPLALVTKGDSDEQHAKLERSGLAAFFRHCATVPEKDAACYRDLTGKFGADAARTWMIGNSPKSDINPAIEAGLGAVLVPHRNTWSLEIQAIPSAHERFRAVERFSDLANLF